MRLVNFSLGSLIYYSGIKKRKGTLVYLGFHVGGNFSQIFYRYERCYAFEANPELLKHPFARMLSLFPNVHLYNEIISDKKGELEFNISNNEAGASSIADQFNQELYPNLKMVKKIKGTSINLMEFLKENKVDFIDEYVSDLQGYDLLALKTLAPMIKDRKIKNITCEVSGMVNTKDQKGYPNAPDNSFAGYEAILNDNYYLFSTGLGILKKRESSFIQ